MLYVQEYTSESQDKKLASVILQSEVTYNKSCSDLKCMNIVRIEAFNIVDWTKSKLCSVEVYLDIAWCCQNPVKQRSVRHLAYRPTCLYLVCSEFVNDKLGKVSDGHRQHH